MNRKEKVREAEEWLKAKWHRNYEDWILGEVEWERAHEKQRGWVVWGLGVSYMLGVIAMCIIFIPCG